MNVGTPCVSYHHRTPPPIVKDTSHLLWTSHIFPARELPDNSISPATILTILANDNATRFTNPIDCTFTRLHPFRLQTDGGANHSITKNRDFLRTYWDIAPYNIGGIRAGIVCTGKVIFHLICDNNSIIPITMFFSTDATETVISPTDAVFSNSYYFDSWWQMADYTTGTGNLWFYSSNEITIASVPLIVCNRLWYLEQDISSTIYYSKFPRLVMLLCTLLQDRPSTIYGTTASVTQVNLLQITLTKSQMEYPICANAILSFHVKTTLAVRWQRKYEATNKTPNVQPHLVGDSTWITVFFRGAITIINEDGPLTTSKEGYNYYLLIADEFSRHLWIFLFAN